MLVLLSLLCHSVGCVANYHLSFVKVHVCICLFAPLKGSAQSRPFVVGTSGHQPPWFMDLELAARQRLPVPGEKPPKSCQHRVHNKHPNWHPSHAVCPSIIALTQHQRRHKNKSKSSEENPPCETDFTQQQQRTCSDSETFILKCSKVEIIKVGLTFQTKLVLPAIISPSMLLERILSFNFKCT